MKIAVIGATGVLGKNLVSLLLNYGHRIIILTRSESNGKEIFNNSVSVVEYDLLANKNDELLADILAGVDCVVNAAASTPSENLKLGAWKNNTGICTYGTKKLINASLKSGVKKFVQQSVATAYPDNGENWITEELPLDDSDFRNGMCAPVIEMENMLMQIPYGKMQWNILRGGFLAGKGTFQKNTISNIRNGLEVIPGDGMNYLSLIHVKDFANAFVKIIDSEVSGKILNIVDRPIRQKDYVERLAVNLGEGGYIFNRSLPLPPSQKCSNNLAKSLLNWTPEEDIFSVKNLLTAV